MRITTSEARIWRNRYHALPPDPVSSIVEWARENVKMPGSARSQSFVPEITPWNCEPMEGLLRGVRKETYVKPVQAGGSAAGEAVACYILANEVAGDLMYNWPNDEAADDRWSERVEKILKACRPLMDRIGSSGLKWKAGRVVMPHMNLIMQGINTKRAVASRSIRFQINEELHIDDAQGWSPGKLEQAYARTTAYWNSYIFNISNAGNYKSQLHQAFIEGTQQHWEVKCPGCGLYHVMRARWDDKEPHLGGLRYDSDGCKREDGSYNYEKLKGTIRYQMPCGYPVPDDVTVRRALSLSGRYGAPTNPDALLIHRSHTLQAVSVDYITFISLIQQKHKALRDLHRGDKHPWEVYLRERESIFVSPDDRPALQNIVLSQNNNVRSGIPDRDFRFGGGDYQQGTLAAGELPHWWLVIGDVKKLKNDRVKIGIVFEGKCYSDEELVGTLKKYEVLPTCVALDSGFDARHVYQMCLMHGYNAIKGADRDGFYHADSGKKIFEAERPLHTMINCPPVHPYVLSKNGRRPSVKEPMFWHYSKAGVMELFTWLRSSPLVDFEIPADVSKEFIANLSSWEPKKTKIPKSEETKIVWTQLKTRDDLFMCLCYIAMLMEMAGVIGAEKPSTPIPATN